MAIRKRVLQAIQYLRFRYRLWKYHYFIWSIKPKLFGVVFVIGLIAILLSEKAIIDYKYEVMDPKADALESVAMAVERTPDLWLKKIEGKKGKVTEYAYQLEYQKYEYFAKKAPSLAEKIRNNKFREVLKDVGRLSLEQGVQYGAGKVVGKIAGKGVKYIEPQIKLEMGRAGVKLFNRGYRTAARIVTSSGEKIVESTTKMGEVSTSLIWEIGSAMGAKTTMPPARELAQKSPEFAALFELLKQATEENPDKLMQAFFNHDIWILVKNFRMRDDPEDYRAAVMGTAKKYLKLTKEGGSQDSMWNNVEDLAKWLANKVGRPLPEPEPEFKPPPPSTQQKTQLIEFPDRSGNYQIRLTFPNGECKAFDTFELEGRFITNLHLENAKSGQSNVKVKVEVIEAAVNTWRLYHRYNMTGTREVNKTIKDYSETTTEFTFNVGPVDTAEGEYGNFYVIHIDESPSGVAVFVFTIPM